MIRPGLEAELRLQMMTALRRGIGFDRPPIDVCRTDLEFIQRYGLMVGTSKPDFVGYKHLIEPYEDDHNDQVFMAGAQTGKSARIQVRVLRAGVQHWGAHIGYFFPDYPIATRFSQQIFQPFVRSSPDLGPWLGTAGDGKKATNQATTRKFGNSTIYFLSTSSRTATEGLPLKAIFFDEVRKMAMGDIQRAEERTSAQKDPINFKVSTAFHPNSDIHAYFMRGDQRYFHSFCRCSEGVALSLCFPDCVADLRGATPQLKAKVEHAFFRAGLPYCGMTDRERKQYGEAAFLCPRCGEWIVDPRDGWWEPHNSGAWIHSYQMPQMLTPAYNPGRVWSKYHRPGEMIDIREIWNSMLGLPYIDKNEQPVQLEDLLSCVTTEARWTTRMTDSWRRKNVKNTALGMDAMGGYNCIVIKEIAPSGKYRTIHLEIAHGPDPWKRAAELMVLFDVRVAVIDCNPHWNEAHRFATAFMGRVWLANYNDSGPGGELVSWKDRKKAPAGQQKAGDLKFKFRVTVSRTKALQWSLGRWKKRLNEVPDPKGLVASLPKQNGRVILTAGLAAGTFEATPICQDVYFLHLQRVIIVKKYPGEGEEREENVRQGNFRLVAEHVELDPHFAHANLYADLACARLAGKFKVSGEGEADSGTDREERGSVAEEEED